MAFEHFVNETLQEHEYHQQQECSALERNFGSSNLPEPPSSVASAWQHMWEVCGKPVMLVYIPFLLACHGVSLLILSRYFKGLKLQKIAGSLSMYPALFALIYLSHAVLLDSTYWGSPQARFHLSSKNIDVFANLYIAANIVQSFGQIHMEKPPYVYHVMAHHTLSAACYATGLYLGRYYWWGVVAGTCEVTNLFLIPTYICKEFFPEWREQTWYLWNTRLRCFFFITHRLFVFPAWLVLWFWDRWTHSVAIHWVEGVIYPATILGLLVLSSIWYRMIRRSLQTQTIIYWEAQKKQKKRKAN